MAEKQEVKPEQAPVGEGMARQAIDTIKLHRQFQESVLAAAVAGDPHPEFEDWVKEQQAQK